MQASQSWAKIRKDAKGIELKKVIAWSFLVSCANIYKLNSNVQEGWQSSTKNFNLINSANSLF